MVHAWRSGIGQFFTAVFEPRSTRRKAAVLEWAILTIVLAFALVRPTMAGPMEHAADAYSKGDYPAALLILRPLAEKGDPLAQNNLGAMYALGQGVTKSDADAATWYRLAADHGFAKAQNNLGVAYGAGRGVPQDGAEAVKWLRLAADQGLADAEDNLGVIYANGQGVPRNYLEAMKWYTPPTSESENLWDR
jgi:hypothetical protein